MLGDGVGWTPLSPRCTFGEHLLPRSYNEKHFFITLLSLQLLNHMDGTGPPPMAKENIADIPTVIRVHQSYFFTSLAFGAIQYDLHLVYSC